MTAPATTAGCGTTRVNAATPFPCARHERANDRAHSTPNNSRRTPKSPDAQAPISSISRSYVSRPVEDCESQLSELGFAIYVCTIPAQAVHTYLAISETGPRN